MVWMSVQGDYKRMDGACKREPVIVFLENNVPGRVVWWPTRRLPHSPGNKYDKQC